MFLSSKTKNKQIAKNSVFLYIRMFISMAITLYTSRVVLQALGIDCLLYTSDAADEL